MPFTKYINNSNYVSSGYTLNSGAGTYSGYYIAATIGSNGKIGGVGLILGPPAVYTVVNFGEIAATTSGANGVSFAGYGTVVNGSTIATAARIAGAYGTAGIPDHDTYTTPKSVAYGGVGGAGISLAQGGTVSNFAMIAGGHGGHGSTFTTYSFSHLIGYPGGRGGAGGAGIVLSQAGTVDNTGLIVGGGGGYAGYGSGYEAFGAFGAAGGAGIVLSQGGTVDNGGTIAGGGGAYGGNSGTYDGGAGGAGGDGIVLAQDGKIDNAGLVAGGAGGIGGFGGVHSANGAGGAGGAGILLSHGGTITNTGTIVAGVAAGRAASTSRPAPRGMGSSCRRAGPSAMAIRATLER